MRYIYSKQRHSQNFFFCGELVSGYEVRLSETSLIFHWGELSLFLSGMSVNKKFLERFQHIAWVKDKSLFQVLCRVAGFDILKGEQRNMLFLYSK